MDIETAKYIIDHYSKFLSDKEKFAYKHYLTIKKIDNIDDNKRQEWVEKCRQLNMLTNDKDTIDLLNDGITNFEIVTAKRLLENFPDKIFLNKCPKCGLLARTPTARQCRHCGHKWFNK
jgi:hypothetical protein